MTPVPQIDAPAGPGVKLISGRVLNQICAALRARTQLNAPGSSPKGKTPGATIGPGALPPATDGPYAPNRVYVVGPQFWARLLQQINGRKEASAPPGMVPAAAKSTTTTLAQIEDVLRKLTPVSPVKSGPAGYTLGGRPARVARLVIETESRAASASVCAMGESLETPGNFVTKTTDVSVFENGSITATVEASGVIQTWEAGEEPEACAELVYENDFDPELDYGEFVSSSYTEDLVSFETLLAAAITAAGTAAVVSASYSFEWPEPEWKAVSADGGYATGTGSTIGVTINISTATAAASTHRWRIRNAGDCTLRVAWRLLRSPGDVEIETGSITVGRGQTSDWIGPPAIGSDPSEHLEYSLKVRLGPY